MGWVFVTLLEKKQNFVDRSIYAPASSSGGAIPPLIVGAFIFSYDTPHTIYNPQWNSGYLLSTIIVWFTGME